MNIKAKKNNLLPALRGRSMRRILTRAAAAVSALAVAAVSLISCEVNVKPQKSAEDDLRVVGTVAGRDVLYDELRFIAVNSREMLAEKYGAGIWEDAATAETYREELTRLVVKGMESSYYAVISMANDYYIGGAGAMLSEKAIEETVAAEVNATAEECGGKKAYLKELENNALTDRLYRFYLSVDEMATELTYVLKTDLGLIPSSDDELNEFMHSDKFIRTNHIYIKGLEDDRLALAEELRQKLLESDSPDLELILLKGRYDSDFSITTTHGVYFARYTSDYGDEYEKTAFALEVGGISGIVAGKEGYYVIMRLPVEDDWLQYNFEDFSEAIIGSEFNLMVDDYREKLEFSFNEFGASVDLIALK